MTCTIPVRTFSSSTFGSKYVSLGAFGIEEKPAKKRPVSTTVHKFEYNVLLTIRAPVSRASEFWNGVYNGIRGRSRKSARDFVIDPTMSVDDILKAIGG